MVYKYYVKKKNGKIFGPYYYRSYRVGNEIRKEYLGRTAKRYRAGPAPWRVILNAIRKMRLNGVRPS